MLWTYDITGENKLSMTNDTYTDNIFWYPVAYVLTPMWCASYFATDPRFLFLFRDRTAQKEWRRRKSPESAAACRNPQTKAAGPCVRAYVFPSEKISQSLAARPISRIFNDRPGRIRLPIERKRRVARSTNVKSIDNSSLSCV